MLNIYLWFQAVAQSHTHKLPREVSLYETEKERSNESVSREGSQESSSKIHIWMTLPQKPATDTILFLNIIVS